VPDDHDTRDTGSAGADAATVVPVTVRASAKAAATVRASAKAAANLSTVPALRVMPAFCH
jgi:hypothetical protein